MTRPQGNRRRGGQECAEGNRWQDTPTEDKDPGHQQEKGLLRVRSEQDTDDQGLPRATAGAAKTSEMRRRYRLSTKGSQRCTRPSGSPAAPKTRKAAAPPWRRDAALPPHQARHDKTLVQRQLQEPLEGRGVHGRPAGPAAERPPPQPRSAVPPPSTSSADCAITQPGWRDLVARPRPPHLCQRTSIRASDGSRRTASVTASNPSTGR